jgi:hypothetical protein
VTDTALIEILHALAGDVGPTACEPALGGLLPGETCYRAGNARRDTPGAGSGLAITKTIVERQGGRIDLHSVGSRGTTVTVTMPLGPEPDGGHDPCAVAGPGTTLAGTAGGQEAA